LKAKGLSDEYADNPQAIEKANSHKTIEQNQSKKCLFLNLQCLHDTTQYGKIKLMQDIRFESG
jgi:hypothetical protein